MITTIIAWVVVWIFFTLAAGCFLGLAMIGADIAYYWFRMGYSFDELKDDIPYMIYVATGCIVCSLGVLFVSRFL